MKQLRFFFFCAAAAAVFFLFPDCAIAAPCFSDVPENAWYADDVQALARQGIITGDGDGAFRPDAPIVEGEFVLLLQRAGGDDVSGINSRAPLTRARAAALLVQSLALPTGDIPAAPWADVTATTPDACALAVCGRLGLFVGDGNTVRPDALLRRAESCAIVRRLLTQPDPAPFVTVDCRTAVYTPDALRPTVAGLWQRFQSGNDLSLPALTGAEACNAFCHTYLRYEDTPFSLSADALAFTASYADLNRAQLRNDAVITEARAVDSAVLAREMSPRCQYLTLNNYVCARLQYDNTVLSAPQGYTAYYGFATGRGVCSTYAALFQSLCDAAGLPCCTYTGMSAGGAHAWNGIFLDGQWYLIDCTWNDNDTAPNCYLFRPLSERSQWSATAVTVSPLFLE